MGSRQIVRLMSAMVVIFLMGCGSAPTSYTISKPAKDDRAIRPKASLREEAVTADIGRWAVVIGISDYKYDTHWDKRKGIPDLRYADRDAEAFAQFLMFPQGGAFPKDHVLLLTDRKATASEVRNAIGDFLARSLENDLVIIYFAGHGISDPNNPENLYLACYDTVPGKYYGTAFPMWGIDDALRRNIQSKRVFVIADACHSAGVGGARGGNVSEKFNTYLEKLAASREGVTKVTASRADELSLEKDYLGGGHGVFTYYLLEALEGKGDRNRDGFVTMDEAYDYVYDKVRSETRHSQKPWVSGYVSKDIPLGIVDAGVLAAVEQRAKTQTARPAAPTPVFRPTPMPDLPKDSHVAVKLAQAKLAKDEPGTALDMAEAVIRRNDSAKPDALALKIAVLLQDRDLKAAEDTEDLLVIPYPDHPAAKKGAGRVYDYYLKELQDETPSEQIQTLKKYIKRHPGGLMTAQARQKLGAIQAGVRADYEKRFRESLTLAKGFIHQNRFERGRKELGRARDMAREAFSSYGVSLDTKTIADLRVESETREKAYRSRMFEEKFTQAQARFRAQDYTSAYRFLEEARECGDPTQLSRADDLARKYNAPPEVSIALDKTTVDWETSVSFKYHASDKEGDPVRVVEWDFGDGTSSSNVQPQHTYAKWRGDKKERQYTVTLKATDGHSTVTAEKQITVKKQECVARDKSYCKLKNGIVKDTKTGLEWMVGPDKDMTWYEAESWVQSLGGDWRMPTTDELEGLYKKGEGDRNMTPLLKTTGWFVWSGETKGSSNAWYFGFDRGDRSWHSRNRSSNDRALAVRFRSNSQRQKGEAASIPSKSAYSHPSSSSSNITGRAEVYVPSANGIVKDTRTGLEWKVGPDRDIGWNEARSWVESLGSGWRMPTMDELESLYNRGRGNRNMTPLLKTTGWFVWSVKTKGSSDGWPFDFGTGQRYLGPSYGSSNLRAFAVRSRSDG